MAANQGYAVAQAKLGEAYETGLGVRQDYAEAVKWYRLSSDQGFSLGQLQLGRMYESGTGIKQDFAEATRLYRLAAAQGQDKARQKVASLSDGENCATQATTQLFGVKLKCASRAELRWAVKGAGARAKEENNNNWGDSYFSDSVLQGTSELKINYTVDNFFAEASYTFRGETTVQKLIEVKDFVAKKYGEPDSLGSYIDPATNSAKFVWRLEDGITVTIAPGFLFETLLTYEFPKNHKAMLKEKERQENERYRQEMEQQAKQYENQNNAF